MLLVSSVVVPGPVEQQGEAGAEGHEREQDADPAGQQRQAGVDAVADGAELLAPQGQGQEDAERDQADGPQVPGLARARTAAAPAAAGRLARLAGFLVVRAAGRAAVPPRVLVTTVRSRLLADLVLFVDTSPVELRTYVRYRSPPWHFAGPWPRTRRAARSSPTSGWRNATSGKGAYAGMEFLHVNARTIINTVPAESRMPFRHTINPYRGCSHACVYCFARPTHDYLGLGIGTDFERKIVVKVNAVERLRAELRAPGWDGDHIAMGTNTDPYQHAEGKYHLTRGIVETLSGARNPFSILTKSTLILRDAALLAAACERTEVGVSFSIGTLDRSVWSLTEPGTPPPDRRVEALRRLTAMGIPCGVLVAPVLPGLSDSEAQLTEVVEACADGRGGVDLRRGAAPARHGPGPLPRLAAGERPDLVRLHRERFRRGAYQEDDERQRVEGIVKVAARRCGVTGRNRYRGRPPARPARRAAPAGRERPGGSRRRGQQLRLL